MLIHENISVTTAKQEDGTFRVTAYCHDCFSSWGVTCVGANGVVAAQTAALEALTDEPCRESDECDD